MRSPCGPTVHGPFSPKSATWRREGGVRWLAGWFIIPLLEGSALVWSDLAGVGEVERPGGVGEQVSEGERMGEGEGEGEGGSGDHGEGGHGA